MTSAPAVIELMYDDRFLGAGSMLQVLAAGLPLLAFGLIRDCYNAQARFSMTAAFHVVQTVTIWAGLYLALAVFESLPAALAVIAFHKLPELAFLFFFARREGWVDLLKEIRFAPLVLVGALLGVGLSEFIFMIIR